MSHNQLMPRSEEVIDNKITLALKVAEAYTSKDVGKGIARIDYNVMRALEVSIRDIIEISGKKKTTAARCLPLELAREKENKYIIGIDRLVRYNARLAIGDTVNVSRINAIAADKITIKPLTAMAIAKNSLIDERYLCDALRNVPIRFMDVVVIPYFKFGMAFTVISIIPFNSDHIDFSSTAFTVTKNTKFEIKSPTRRFGICRSCFWTASYLKYDSLHPKRCPVDGGNLEILETK
jgi:transitional endoplasmic reticulum ATPase